MELVLDSVGSRNSLVARSIAEEVELPIAWRSRSAVEDSFGQGRCSDSLEKMEVDTSSTD